MSGILFQTLFTRGITEDAEQELLSRAAALAETLSEAAGSERPVPTGMHPGMGRGAKQRIERGAERRYQRLSARAEPAGCGRLGAGRGA